MLNQASCFVAAKLYIDNIDVTVEVEGLHTEEVKSNLSLAVMTILQVAFSLWLASLIGFFASIDKNYLHTFVDIASGKQHVAREFRNATSDFEKLQIFGFHKSYWASTSLQKEIKEFMDENYEVFETEKPEWWTELLISTIPDDYIPKEDLKVLEKKGVGGKRKKSVVLLGGHRIMDNEERGGDSGENKVLGLARRLSIGQARINPAAGDVD